MKCRVHYVSPKQSAEAVAEVIARECKCVKEPLLPAYMPENVFLMFLGIEKKADKTTLQFISTLNKDRVANCALFCCGQNDAAVAQLREALTSKGINVLDEVFTAPCKGLFAKGPTDADLEKAKVFAQNCMKKLEK